jgi:hypothetical protein
MVSALSSKAYEQLSPLVKSIYDIDLDVSRDTRLTIDSPEEAIKRIADHKDIAFQLKSEIMKNVANINTQTIKMR